LIKLKADLPTVNLAIIGAEGVGKSTFIQCALDLKRPPTSRSSAKKMSLEGSVYVVNLWKVSVDEITIEAGQTIIWPQSKGEQILPSVDGVLVLFDATSPESVVETSDTLSKSACTLYSSFGSIQFITVIKSPRDALVLNMEKSAVGTEFRSNHCFCMSPLTFYFQMHWPHQGFRLLLLPASATCPTIQVDRILRL
jgi:GTPase SAR1 family protein